MRHKQELILIAGNIRIAKRIILTSVKSLQAYFMYRFSAIKHLRISDADSRICRKTSVERK